MDFVFLAFYYRKKLKDLGAKIYAEDPFIQNFKKPEQPLDNYNWSIYQKIAYFQDR